MNIDYILTAFSPAMFGEGATTHIQLIPLDEAQSLVDDRTIVMATKNSRLNLAKTVFPQATQMTRYVSLSPGEAAIIIHYRGPPLPNDGHLPAGAVISAYLIEVEELQEECAEVALPDQLP